MKNSTQEKFYNPTQGNIGFNEVVEEIVAWMQEKPQKEYEVIVGCDSSSDKEPHFPVAVVILRKGEGGRFFLKKIKYKNKKFFNWHQRILEEVLISCDLALKLREALELKIGKLPEIKKRFQFKYIHADIGEEGATRDMIKEVIGLIRGNGFEAKIKPEAYVASVVADRFS
ncbi:hypothetical protein J7K03_03080 [bacterium]|nr:hypothetical protein [bacterium]